MGDLTKVIIVDALTGSEAEVIDGVLQTSGSGGGAGTDVNIAAVGGNLVTDTVPVSAPNITTSGTISAAGQNVTLALLDGVGAAMVQITGTASAPTTFVFEGSADGGTTYWPILTQYQTEGFWIVQTGYSSGLSGALFRIPASGLTHVRVRCSVHTGADVQTITIVGSRLNAGWTAAPGGTLTAPGVTAIADQYGTVRAGVVQPGASDNGWLQVVNNLLQINSTTVAVNAGNANNGTQRVILATDQPAIPTTAGANTTASGTLGALNATVAIVLTAGLNSVGFQLIDTAFLGTIAAEESFDGGTTWNETDLYRPLSADTFNRQSRLTSPGNFAGVIHVSPGATDARLRVQTYTSGSSAATLSATGRPYEAPSYVASDSGVVQGIALVGGRYAAPASTNPVRSLVVTDVIPPSNASGLIVRDCQVTVADGGAPLAQGTQIMFRDVDSGVMAPFEMRQANPAGTERGLIVRNIPSGTQAVSGTIAISGSVAVTGPLTDVQLRATPVPVSAVNLDIRDLVFATDKVDVTGSTIAISGSVAVTGPLTDAQLRATPVPVSSTQLPAALVGARLDTNIGAWLGSTAPTVGSKASASSVPVVIASDQGAVPVSGTLTAVTSITNPVSTKTDLTPSAPTVASVGVASAQAVAAAATRKGLILRNLSTTGQRISLGFGSAAVLDSGVTLFPQDAFAMEEFDFDLGAVNAIASAASASLAVQEYLT